MPNAVPELTYRTYLPQIEIGKRWQISSVSSVS